MRSLSPLRILAVAALLGALAAPGESQTGVGTAFTYQGSLHFSGSPVSGLYDFEFKLFDAAASGTQIGGTVALRSVSVQNGIFTLPLNFGAGRFLGDARWLEVGVKPAGDPGAYTVFPRQSLAPTPFAMALGLPHDQAFGSPGYLFQMRNTGGGSGAFFSAGGTALNYGLVGENGSTAAQSAGVRGVSTVGQGIGVEGVATVSDLGTGLAGRGKATGAWIEGTGPTSTGLYAFGYSRGLYAENLGTGPAAYLTGQGQSAGNATLRVENTQPTQGMATYMHVASTYATAHFQNDGTGEVLWLQNPNGSGPFIVAVGAGGDLKFKVDQTGKTQTKVLQILGGADLSERFDVDGGEDARAGMVVSVDPEREGRLEVSSHAYDRRVAGILSGAKGIEPGMVMSQQGSVADGDRAVALTGRVYCWVDASYGAVEPGDLLTTSDTPGHAMKVGNPARAAGAVIGKAMGRLEKGRGLVLVLVGLQ